MKDEEIINSILGSLQELIERARSRRMWLRSPYQDLWFSPDELEAQNNKGKFLWGPDNWELRDPKERIQQLERLIKRAMDNLIAFKRRQL